MPPGLPALKCRVQGHERQAGHWTCMPAHACPCVRGFMPPQVRPAGRGVRVAAAWGSPLAPGLPNRCRDSASTRAHSRCLRLARRGEWLHPLRRRGRVQGGWVAGRRRGWGAMEHGVRHVQKAAAPPGSQGGPCTSVPGAAPPARAEESSHSLATSQVAACRLDPNTSAASAVKCRGGSHRPYRG